MDLKQLMVAALAAIALAGCSADGGLDGAGGGGGGNASLTDADGDGVPNSRDVCPNTPEGTSVDSSGCGPEETPSADEDGDGVPDDFDQCSGTEAGASVNSAGCASGQTIDNPDSDGDGVIDDTDQCPNTASGAAVDENGCADNQEPVTDPILIDLGELGGTVSEIAGRQCNNFVSGVGTEVTEGLACTLGDTLGLTLCVTSNPEAAADGIGDGSTEAVVELVTSLLVLPPLPTEDLTANAGVNVTGFGTVAEGNVAGFFVEFPTDTADVNVIQSLMVNTYLAGAEQETRDLLQPLGVGLGGAQLVGGTAVLVGFENTLPYDELEIVFGGTVEAEAISLTDLNPSPSVLLGEVGRVWNACVSADPAPAAQ